MPETAPLLVGADVGGSKIEVVAGTGPENILARSRAASKPPRVVGARSAAITIAAAVKRTLHSAGLASRADAFVVGIAGAADPETSARLAEALRSTRLSDRVQVCTDAELVLSDVFAAGPGLVLIAGTGSIVMGRVSSGELVRAGGLGPASEDPGSGYALGIGAVRLVVSGGAEPAFCTAIKDGTSTPLPSPFDGSPGNHPPAATAVLARTVLELAANGDPTAIRLAKEGAESLARMVVDAAGHFGEANAPRLALAGGLLGNRYYREAVISAVSKRAPALEILDREPDAALGALKLAATT